jgi:hypothetical protein
MRVLIDIGHPAHVHLFKHFAWDMQKRGHEVFFTCRDKEFEIYLLEKYGFKYTSFGKKYTSKAGKLWGLLKFDVNAFSAGLKFKPDIFLSHGSIYAAHAAFLMGKPHISLEDTFNFEQINLYKPFTKAILTADYDHPLKSEKVVRYAGNHELAYLHPNRYTPGQDAFEMLGLAEDEPYILLRFVAWHASHDFGRTGISLENKIRAVKEFSKYARVFISAEKDLPPDLEPYKIQIPPEKMHDILAHATLFFGESATMASESAMIGTPAVYVNQLWFGLTEEEKEYGLLFSYRGRLEDQGQAIQKGIELLKNPKLKKEMQENRHRFLENKIDVTAFMAWFVENYPDSYQIMKKNPDYQHRFRQRLNGLPIGQ